MRISTTFAKQIIAGSSVVAVAAVAFYLTRPAADPVPDETSTLPVVSTITAAEHAGTASVSLIGTVRAFSEAAVTADQSGRVTSVPVRLGQTVQAGQIIATLDSASEQAAVLQAEGVYEAALASAAQSDVGTDEATNQLNSAKNNAVTTFKTTYGTVNNIVLTTVDQFFSRPNTTLPGLLVDGREFTNTLNSERVAYQAILPDWQQTAETITSSSELVAELTYANQQTARTIALIDMFISVFNQQDSGSRYTTAELQGFITQFTNARTSLVNAEASIDNALTQLTAAEEGLERAELAASGSQNSAADAQVKQALGSLRAAQASFQKRIIRTPIAGTVNTLAVRTGDFVGGQQQVAEVANNDALEIVTTVGELERDAIALSDEVIIEGQITGVITEIAPAIDPATGKIEVRIAAESGELKNGDTVTISYTATTSSSDRVFVPLSAVKFQQTDGSVFIVVDGVLEARAVTTGVVRGGSVEITSGLSATEAVVSDARGLQSGTAVEVTS